jgi:hypothetical protein
VFDNFGELDYRNTFGPLFFAEFEMKKDMTQHTRSPEILPVRSEVLIMVVSNEDDSFRWAIVLAHDNQSVSVPH